MGEIERLVKNIKRNTEEARQAQIRFVECVSVDWENKTMTATGTNDGSEYFDIALGLGSIYIKPAPGSVCLIGLIDGQEVATFLIDAEVVELAEIISTKIVFNAGENLGLVKVKELTDKLNNLEKGYNKLLSDYRVHNHITPDGVTAGFVTPPVIGDITETTIKDIQNDNIKH